MTKHHKLGYDVCATDFSCPKDSNVTNEELQQTAMRGLVKTIPQIYLLDR